MFDQGFYQSRLEDRIEREGPAWKEAYDDQFRAMFQAAHGNPNREARRRFIASTIGFGNFWRRHLIYQVWLRQERGGLKHVDYRHESHGE